MALSNTTILYIVELAIYLLLNPALVYLAFLHGSKGALGFFYILTFTLLRIISDIIFIAQRNNPTPSEAASIVSSIGLSPLLLALAGLVHEIHVYLVNATHTPARAKEIGKWMWIAQILFHMAAAAGIGIVITGTVGVINSQKKGEAPKSSDETEREVGSIVLLITWVVMAIYAAWVFRSVVRTNSPVRRTLRAYVLGVFVGSLFVGVRAVYSVVYSFEHGNTSLSPITGSFAVKLVLVVLVQWAAIVSWTVGAWTARHIKKEEHDYQPARSGSPGERHELIPPSGYKRGPVQA